MFHMNVIGPLVENRSCKGRDVLDRLEILNIMYINNIFLPDLAICLHTPTPGGQGNGVQPLSHASVEAEGENLTFE